MSLETAIIEMLEQMENIVFENGEIDDVECRWIIENKSDYDFEKVSFSIIEYDKDDVIIENRSKEIWEFSAKSKVRVNAFISDETKYILIKFEGYSLDGRYTKAKEMSSCFKDIKIDVPKEYYKGKVFVDWFPEVDPKILKEIGEKQAETRKAKREKQSTDYNKKEKSIKFLHSIDILSEEEMNAILNYLKGDDFFSRGAAIEGLVIDEVDPDEEKFFKVEEVRKNNTFPASFEIKNIEGMTVRTRNCLMRRGISTIGELTSYTKFDLRKTRNLGSKSYKELMTFVKENNIVLKDANAFLLYNLDFGKDTLYCLDKIGKTTVGDLVNSSKEEMLEFIKICKERSIDYTCDILVFETCEIPQEIMDVLRYPHLYK